jgi:hypothetical protein
MLPGSAPARAASPRALRLVLPLALAGLCLLVPQARAQDLVRHVFVSAQPDPELEEVLYFSMGVELADLGFSSTRTGAGAGYILTTEYEKKGSEVEVRFSLAKAKNAGAPVATAAAVLHLDLSLDTELATALRSLVEAARVEPAQDAGAPNAIGGLFSSDLITVEDTLRTKKTMRLETLACCGGVSFIGDLSNYASYGATASLDAGLLFLKPSWSLSGGLRVTATRAFMNEGVLGGTLYLGTAGLNVQVGAGAAQAQRLSACLSGGAAFLTVANGTEVLAKTVPYLDAGIQAGVALGRDFFLGGDVRFLIAFDEDILVMGAVPSISLCKEF